MAFPLAMLAACAPSENARQSPADSASADTAVQATVGPSTPAVFLRDCARCRLDVGNGVAPFSLAFEVRDTPGNGRVIAALRLTRGDRPGWAQVLTPRDSAAAATNDEFMVGATDIDRDGYSDLLVATARGVANTYADYWRYRPDSGDFRHLGNFPVFTLDSASRRLSTYERGGDGGMIHESRQYEFRGDELVLVESETQEATSRAGEYRRTLRRLRGGALEVVSTTVVRAPAG